jgi:hypothetical protein
MGGGVGDGGLPYLGSGYETWALEIVRTRGRNGGPFSAVSLPQLLNPGRSTRFAM